jgi:hypothetical protein
MTLPGSRAGDQPVTASRACVRGFDLELHRRQCEARYWSRQPDLKATLERIAKVRGQKAAEQLAEDIRAIRRKG